MDANGFFGQNLFGGIGVLCHTIVRGNMADSTCSYHDEEKDFPGRQKNHVGKWFFGCQEMSTDIQRQNWEVVYEQSNVIKVAFIPTVLSTVELLIYPLLIALYDFKFWINQFIENHLKYKHVTVSISIGRINSQPYWFKVVIYIKYPVNSLLFSIVVDKE